MSAIGRRSLIIGGLSTLAAVGGARALSTSESSGDAARSGADDRPNDGTPRPASRTTVKVRRGSLETEHELGGTASYGDTWAMPITATGVVTHRHDVGTIVEPGNELVSIDAQPVFLVAGAMPMYRTLELIDTSSRDEFGNRRQELVGYDVLQLQQFLIGLGAATEDLDIDITADGVFGKATRNAVRAWQKSAGIPVSGSVDATQMVFSADPVRIAAVLRVGSKFEKLEVSAPDPIVTVDTNARQRSLISVDTSVEISSSSDEKVPGTVTTQERVVLDDGPAWRSTIAVDGVLDGTGAVTVTVTEVVAKDTLIVPVGALLALGEGGYAVERVNGATTTLIAVELNDVLGGRASVTGDIAVDDELVVAT